MKMRKLLFTAYSLDVGGIEKALVNLLRFLDYTKYEVTLIVEKKEGIFLDQIPYDVQILEYKISDCPFVFLRKIKNRLKLWSWQARLKNKYDFSCSFATYSIPGSLLARAASSNSTLWMHGNYYVLYNRNEKALMSFLDGIGTRKFKRIVFVSNENKREVCSHYEGIEEKSIVCNNFINEEEIIKQSKETVSFKKTKGIPLFVNVGRHDEYQKRLSRIIDASERLVSEGYKFQVLFIGDGPDSISYSEQIRTKGLEDVIINLGRKKNPYPYYKMADAVLLSSEYEGFPVVYLESLILKKPILSTKVSDYEELENVYGMFCDFNTESVYNMMKSYIENGFTVTEKFDASKYNKEIEEKIISMIEDK